MYVYEVEIASSRSDDPHQVDIVAPSVEAAIKKIRASSRNEYKCNEILEVKKVLKLSLLGGEE